MDSALSLLGLFVSSLLAATLLPGGSEFVLAALLIHNPLLLWPALAVATLGNTLGGMSSYAIGRLLPGRVVEDRYAKHLALLSRHGAPALLLSWVPLLGDALCVAAGWVRMNATWCATYMMIGKFMRYWILALATV